MLPKDIMRRVREIQVRTGRQVTDVLAGEYVSVFKGSGIEFDEVRPYTPGDDIRHTLLECRTQRIPRAIMADPPGRLDGLRPGLA